MAEESVRGAPRLPIIWSRRAVPLRPSLVAGMGTVGTALLRSALRRGTADQLRGLRCEGMNGQGDLVVLSGPEEALPWADGARWLGVDPRAPGLWLPTLMAPHVHPELLARALRAKVGPGPVALLLDPPRLVHLAQARSLDDHWLCGHLSRRGGPTPGGRDPPEGQA